MICYTPPPNRLVSAGLEIPRIVTADSKVGQAAPQVAQLAVKTFGKIDGLVINHGTLSRLERLENTSIEEWKRAFDINFFSSVALV